ncbi:MAG: class II aldolase/adducin family protein [Gemmatimonadaceae bacterium]|nr:class II aldolase/adducin family protein [Gemmatimonadaceae bacterium]
MSAEPTAGQVWEQAEALAAACRRLHARGLLAGAEGNLSVRLADGSVLVTASGIDKARATAAQVVRLHAGGTPHHTPVTGDTTGDVAQRDRGLRASSEVGMHLACYAARADVQAIVHAHPPVATGFATAGQGLPADVLPELPVVVGPVALVPYGRPGTPALAAAMQPFLAGHEVFLLANHGVTTVGRSLTDALLRMESVEQAARILAVARVLGGAVRLPDGEAAALASLHRAGELAGSSLV